MPAIAVKSSPSIDLAAPAEGGGRAKHHFGRLKSAPGARTHWFVDLPAGVNLATALSPTYWAAVTAKLRPMDLIETFCEDGSWEALLRVMFVSQVEVRLSVIYAVSHETADADAYASTDLHEIKWKGPGAQYAVVRRDTGAVIKDHLYPREMALAYMREHLMKLKS